VIKQFLGLAQGVFDALGLSHKSPSLLGTPLTNGLHRRFEVDAAVRALAHGGRRDGHAELAALAHDA
jgi:hypothetical protein